MYIVYAWSCVIKICRFKLHVLTHLLPKKLAKLLKSVNKISIGNIKQNNPSPCRQFFSMKYLCKAYFIRNYWYCNVGSLIICCNCCCIF